MLFPIKSPKFLAALWGKGWDGLGWASNIDGLMLFVYKAESSV